MSRIAHALLESTHGYATTIRAGHHALTADEPQASGGTDTGPAPYQLLLASLAACTAITLRMYAERKKWELGTISVDLEFLKDKDAKTQEIRRAVSFSAELTAEQKTRLGEIAEKTPVTLTLKGGVGVVTEVR
jgi:putative redox protein